MPVYIGQMCRSIRYKSKELEQDLRTRGYPNHFQSQPRVTTHEWDLLQTLDHRTLLYTQVRTGNNGIWSGAVADIVREVDLEPQLLHNLATVQRNVAPTTHATCLRMPSQAFMKVVMREMVDATDAEVHAHMKAAAKTYERYMIEPFSLCLPMQVLRNSICKLPGHKYVIMGKNGNNR